LTGVISPGGQRRGIIFFKGFESPVFGEKSNHTAKQILGFGETKKGRPQGDSDM